MAPDLGPQKQHWIQQLVKFPTGFGCCWCGIHFVLCDGVVGFLLDFCGFYQVSVALFRFLVHTEDLPPWQPHKVANLFLINHKQPQQNRNKFTNMGNVSNQKTN